jgi:HAL2 family 3'(2'),5'-bisphosphate nucleotidase
VKFSQHQPEAAFAVEAVRQASRLVRQVQLDMVEPALSKDDRSPVTVGDFAAQALVGRLLEEAYPADAFVAEESSEALRSDDARATLDRVVGFVGKSTPDATAEAVCAWIDRGCGDPGGRFWVLDPIDGTKGFLRGDQYAVAFALVVDGQVQLGVLGCPNLTEGARPEPGGPGTVVVAVRGEGAWMTSLDSPGESVRLRVSDQSDVSQMRVLRSVEKAHTNTGKIGELVTALGVTADPVGMDSQAKYAVLAAGAGEMLCRLLSPKQPDYREKIWDQAAGSIVVEEAGGRVTDLFGKPLDFTLGRTLANNRGIMASNGHLHDAVLQGLASVGIRD